MEYTPRPRTAIPLTTRHLESKCSPTMLCERFQTRLFWWCSTKHSQFCIVAVQHRHSAKLSPEKNQINGNCRFSSTNLGILLNLLYKLNHNMPKPSKKLSKKRSGIASARKSRHARQRSLPLCHLQFLSPTTPYLPQLHLQTPPFQLLTVLLTQKSPLEVQK